MFIFSVAVGWVLLYVHGFHRLIRDGSPGQPPRLSHSSWALILNSFQGKCYSFFSSKCWKNKAGNQSHYTINLHHVHDKRWESSLVIRTLQLLSHSNLSTGLHNLRTLHTSLHSLINADAIHIKPLLGLFFSLALSLFSSFFFFNSRVINRSGLIESVMFNRINDTDLKFWCSIWPIWFEEIVVLHGNINCAFFRPNLVERLVPVADQYPTHRSSVMCSAY